MGEVVPRWNGDGVFTGREPHDTYNSKKMKVTKIDFQDAKYQVPAGPQDPVDLTQYETQLVGGVDGISTSDYSTKDTIYVAGIAGDNSVELTAANFNASGTKARVSTGAGNDSIYVSGYENFTLIGGAGNDYLE